MKAAVVALLVGWYVCRAITLHTAREVGIVHNRNNGHSIDQERKHAVIVYVVMDFVAWSTFRSHFSFGLHAWKLRAACGIVAIFENGSCVGQCYPTRRPRLLHNFAYSHTSAL